MIPYRKNGSSNISHSRQSTFTINSLLGSKLSPRAGSHFSVIQSRRPPSPSSPLHHQHLTSTIGHNLATHHDDYWIYPVGSDLKWTEKIPNTRRFHPYNPIPIKSEMTSQERSSSATVDTDTGSSSDDTGNGVKKTKRFRTCFTAHQLVQLELEFRRHPYVPCNYRSQLAATLDLTWNQIRVWFQNRRNREKQMKIQAETGFEKQRASPPFIDLTSPYCVDHRNVHEESPI